MAGGPFSGILGGIIGGDDANLGTGILGNMNTAMTQNAGTLLGLGAGLMSGDWGMAAQGAMTGMQQDQRTRLIKQKQAEEEQRKVEAQKLAQAMNLPPGFAASPDDVFALARTVQAQKLTPKEPTEFERLTAGMDPETVEQAKLARLGLNKVPAQWEIKTIKNADGSETPVYFNSRTMETKPVPGYGSTVARQGNPYSTGKMTESEALSGNYADRMAQSHSILNGFEETMTSSTEAGRAAVPLVGNHLASKEYQQAEQAQRDFVNAILRRESGAAISPTEFENARKQYFPQPGDSPQVIEQKRQNRITAIQGNMRSAGNAYRPPSGWEDPNTAGRKQDSAKKAVSAPPAAVDFLRKNPSLRKEFDAKYGPGASAAALGIPDA